MHASDLQCTVAQLLAQDIASHPEQPAAALHALAGDTGLRFCADGETMFITDSYGERLADFPASTHAELLSDVRS